MLPNRHAAAICKVKSCANCTVSSSTTCVTCISGYMLTAAGTCSPSELITGGIHWRGDPNPFANNGGSKSIGRQNANRCHLSPSPACAGISKANTEQPSACEGTAANSSCFMGCAKSFVGFYMATCSGDGTWASIDGRCMTGKYLAGRAFASCPSLPNSLHRQCLRLPTHRSWH